MNKQLSSSCTSIASGSSTASPYPNSHHRQNLRRFLLARNVRSISVSNSSLNSIASTKSVELEDETSKLRKLQNQATKEILTTEETYLKQLEIILNFFAEPLKKSNILKNCKIGQSVFHIFGQIETIYKLNQELFNELTDNIESLAKAFLKFAPFLKLYSVYAFDYKKAIFQIQELLNANSTFKHFLTITESRPEVQSKLMSLLITPIQRLPRYRLLLNQVLYYTSPSEPEYKILNESIKEIEHTCSHINFVIEDQENAEKIINLQNSLQYRLPRIIKPGRRIIKEGFAEKLSSNGSKSKKYLILMTDIFMYCNILKDVKQVLNFIKSGSENSLRCCCIFPLNKSKVTELFAGKFKVSCQGEGVIFYTNNESESKRWISALNDAIEVHVLRKKTLRKLSSHRIPVRKKDIKYLDLNKQKIQVKYKKP